MTATDPIPFDEAPRGSGTPHGVKGIADLLESQGVDASSDLYDEAVVLARQGHLGRARDRLRMLLCLDPHDAQAHLLLGKVFGAQKRWSDALKEVDAAAACGLRVDPTLKGQLEAARDASRDDQARSERISARTAEEVRALRDEARRLRAENTRLERLHKESSDKARLWMSATVVAAVIGLLGVVLSVGFGSADEVTEPAAASEPAALEAPQAPAALDAVPGADRTPPPQLAPAPPAQSRSYTVRSGDSLAGISLKVYGTEARWKDLQDANPKLGGGTALQPGMELVVPD